MSADPNSLSNSHEVRVNHISLVLQVDFEKKVLSGHADFTLEPPSSSIVSELVLDTKELAIHEVLSISEGEKPISFKLDEKPHYVFGRALHIPITSSSSTFRVRYETTSGATALQWLSPSQTAGKKHPYLFTQCQAIHARSMIPCQDTPGVKFTYDARISVPKELTALMSAKPTKSELSSSHPDQKVFFFEQPTPIPSYLLALAVGDVVSRDIGEISKIWSEESMVDKGAYEFAETNAFLKAAEHFAGPYEWGNYDLLLLPPSFPYGGMENPQLTFVTPTLLAGDRSNAGVVAHEIAHSWTGNLVTTRTWEHFWLNEGFTVFLERKILGRLYGEKQYQFEALLGRTSLNETITTYGPDNPLTALVPKLDGIDPDDAFSKVPYEKGFSFLYYLEGLVGGPTFFEPFFKDWIQNHKKSAADSNEFKSYFLNYFKGKEGVNSIDWEAWFYSPGMPPVPLTYDQTLVLASHQLAEKWITGGESASSKDIEGWSAKQIRAFLDRLLENPPLPHSSLTKMDELYNFTKSSNSEIQDPWYRIGIKAEWPSSIQPALDFIVSQGRMKFVRPIYKALYASQLGKERAVETFKANRDTYHAICSKMVAKDLQLD